MSDFAGQEFDFAAGSLLGLRGWKMDTLGRLHGVTHHVVWIPGENVAVCQAWNYVPCPNREVPKISPVDEAVGKKKKKRKLSTEYSFSWYGSESSCDDATCRMGRHQVESGHRFDPDCKCGFWAYDEAGFEELGDVVGVIEGYGKATIGTKGFRCEKARIVALSRDGLSRSEESRLTDLYPGVEFHDDVAALVERFPAVLRSWPEVDDAFWLRPVPASKSSGFSTAGSWTIPSYITWSTA
ncbi:MAG: hypothetical protein ACXV5U_14750 [Ilumatobacteraceae bacterium]